MAVELTVRFHIRQYHFDNIQRPLADPRSDHPSDLLFFRRPILDAVRSRYWSNRILVASCLQRWLVILPVHQSIIPLILWTADSLDRFEMPFFGGLASSFVDNE